MQRPYTVVVGADGSPSSEAALLWAIEEARARHGRVQVITAWASPYDYGLQPLSPVDESPLRKAAERHLQDTLAAADLGGLDVSSDVREGDPRDVLLEAARDADLLVVGSRGRRTIGEVLLGSVSLYCLHHATIPVTIVHARVPRGSGPRI